MLFDLAAKLIIRHGQDAGNMAAMEADRALDSLDEADAVSFERYAQARFVLKVVTELLRPPTSGDLLS